MNRRHYTTGKRGRKAWLAAVLAVIISVAAYAAAEVKTAAEKGPEPDAVFPMANSCISWEQTFHAGAWGE